MDQTGLQRDGYQSYPITTTAVAAAANMTASSRYRSPHGTSSAFSINASPSEDWTKISDLAERRRVQNRIAQRNYRKRLKRRLEDLERKAPSTSASPEPSQAETPQQPKPSQSPKVNRAATRKRKTSTSIHVSHNANHTSLNSSQSPLRQQQVEAYGTMPEERGGSSNIYTKQPSSRQIATSTPTEPFFYPSYPTSQAIYDYNSSYQSPQPNAFQTMPQSHYGELPGQVACQQYLDRSSQRSLSPNSSPSKQMNAFSNDQDLNPLHVNYAPIIGLEAPVFHQPPYNQQTHTPPLTNAYSDGYSTSTSPAGSLNEHFPLTPEHAGSSPDYIIYR